MKLSSTMVSGLVVLALFSAACSDDDADLAAFCSTHTDPELEDLDPSDPEDADKLSAAMASMEKNAPEEIKEDLTTTVEGFEAARAGDIADLDVEGFQAAASRVERYAEDNCTDG